MFLFWVGSLISVHRDTIFGRFHVLNKVQVWQLISFGCWVTVLLCPISNCGFEAISKMYTSVVPYAVAVRILPYVSGIFWKAIIPFFVGSNGLDHFFGHYGFERLEPLV